MREKALNPEEVAVRERAAAGGRRTKLGKIRRCDGFEVAHSIASASDRSELMAAQILDSRGATYRARAVSRRDPLSNRRSPPGRDCGPSTSWLVRRSERCRPDPRECKGAGGRDEDERALEIAAQWYGQSTAFETCQSCARAQLRWAITRREEFNRRTIESARRPLAGEAGRCNPCRSRARRYDGHDKHGGRNATCGRSNQGEHRRSRSSAVANDSQSWNHGLPPRDFFRMLGAFRGAGDRAKPLDLRIRLSLPR